MRSILVYAEMLRGGAVVRVYGEWGDASECVAAHATEPAEVVS